MPFTNYPGGVISQGIPIAPDIACVGKIFFVCGATGFNGGDGNTGLDFKKPLKTVDRAMTLCTANKNDHIVIMPGHTENLDDPADFLCDKAGVTITGVGEGTRLPIFTTTDTDGTIGITAANVTIRNIQIISATADTVSGMTIADTADGFHLDGIQFRDTSSAYELLIQISVATTVINYVIENCSIVGAAGGAATNAILFAGTSGPGIIRNNYFFGDWSDDVIDHEADVATSLYIHDNAGQNLDGTAATDFFSDSTGTGMLAGNWFGGGHVDDEMITIGEFSCFENYMTNTVATSSGVLDPGADTV